MGNSTTADHRFVACERDCRIRGLARFSGTSDDPIPLTLLITAFDSYESDSGRYESWWEEVTKHCRGKPRDMYYLNVWLTVRNDDDIPLVADALRRAGQLSRTEPGCLRWEAYQSESNAKKFLLVETWAAKSDWEVHRTGKAVTEVYLVEVIPRVDREPHPSIKVI